MQSPRTRNRSPIPILTYHQIDAAPPRGAPYRSIYVAPAKFARQMAFLKGLGYQGLSISDLQPYLNGDKVGKVVGITLDDGYLNNLTHALPVLVMYGFSATCYAVSQLAGKTNAWDQGLGMAQTPLMNAAQLRQWVAGGQEVGAHTRHHVRLPETALRVAREEMALCKLELEQAIGAPVLNFCYPYGQYAPEHVDMAMALGYRTATTTNRSRCIAGEDWMQLPRVPVDRTTTLLALWLKLTTRYEDRRRV